MEVYSLHGVTLQVDHQGDIAGLDLSRLLADLSFVAAPSPNSRGRLRLAVRASEAGIALTARTKQVFAHGELRGFADESGSCLTLGASVFRIRGRRADVTLAPEFFHNPTLLQQQFWAFGVLRLLRTTGLFGLHGAGVVSPLGSGMLLVGRSGSGKSTLTIDLVERGWAFVGDDAVLLEGKPDAIEVFALRRPFATCEVNEAADLRPNQQKRRIEMREKYPDQFVPAFVPQVILYPEITPQPKSALRCLAAAAALHRLLEQSGPQFADDAARRHMDVLGGLVQQCAHYELHAGRDLYRNPDKLVALLSAIESGEKDGSNHRRAHQSL